MAGLASFGTNGKASICVARPNFVSHDTNSCFVLTGYIHILVKSVLGFCQKRQKFRPTGLARYPRTARSFVFNSKRPSPCCNFSLHTYVHGYMKDTITNTFCYVCMHVCMNIHVQEVAQLTLPLHYFHTLSPPHLISLSQIIHT
jgi:hypothetical protein